jgi:DNA-binding response OmpR family regulator
VATLLIVEDDKDINEAIGEYLRNANHEIISAYDGADALDKFYENQIDLVVLDIMLPKFSGLAVLKEIRKTSQIPLLMLTAIDNESTQAASFDGQADDYITKPFSMVLLGKRVTALLRRSKKQEQPEIMQFGDVSVNFSGYAACDSDGDINITPKEIETLKLLIEYKGLVLSRTQIIDAIWGDDYPIIDRTIDTYIKNIRKKLKLDCIETVKGVGYKFEVNK